jgi:hypothetical protein
MVDEGSKDEGGTDEGSGERTRRGRATKASSTSPPRVSPSLRKPLWVASPGAGVSSAASGIRGVSSGASPRHPASGGLLTVWGRLAVGRWLGSLGRLPAIGMALSALEGFVSFDGNETVAVRTSLPAVAKHFGGTCGGGRAAASGRCRPSKKSSRATRARAMMAAAVEAATASTSKSAAAAGAGTGDAHANMKGAVVGGRAHPPKMDLAASNCAKLNLAASNCANVMGAGAPKENATGPPKVAEYAGAACHTA